MKSSLGLFVLLVVSALAFTQAALPTPHKCGTFLPAEFFTSSPGTILTSFASSPVSFLRQLGQPDFALVSVALVGCVPKAVKLVDTKNGTALGVAHLEYNINNQVHRAQYTSASAPQQVTTYSTTYLKETAAHFSTLQVNHQSHNNVTLVSNAAAYYEQRSSAEQLVEWFFIQPAGNVNLTTIYHYPNLTAALPTDAQRYVDQTVDSALTFSYKFDNETGHLVQKNSTSMVNGDLVEVVNFTYNNTLLQSVQFNQDPAIQFAYDAQGRWVSATAGGKQMPEVHLEWVPGALKQGSRISTLRLVSSEDGSDITLSFAN